MKQFFTILTIIGLFSSFHASFGMDDRNTEYPSQNQRIRRALDIANEMMLIDQYDEEIESKQHSSSSSSSSSATASATKSTTSATESKEQVVESKEAMTPKEAKVIRIIIQEEMDRIYNYICDMELLDIRIDFLESLRLRRQLTHLKAILASLPKSSSSPSSSSSTTAAQPVAQNNTAAPAQGGFFEWVGTAVKKGVVKGVLRFLAGERS